jgi:hypothetical protein
MYAAFYDLSICSLWILLMVIDTLRCPCATGRGTKIGCAGEQPRG